MEHTKKINTVWVSPSATRTAPLCMYFTVLWRELVVGVLIDVVPSDGDVDAVQERPVALHVPLVCVDQPLEDLQERDQRLMTPPQQEISGAHVVVIVENNHLNTLNGC